MIEINEWEIIVHSNPLSKGQEEKNKALLCCCRTKTKNFFYQEDFDGWWKSFEKNFCVIVLIGVRLADWLINDCEEELKGEWVVDCSSSWVGINVLLELVEDDSTVIVVVVQLSFESDVLLIIVSVVDRQAIECGRDELNLGDDVNEDDDDFRWKYKRVNAGPVV